MLTTTAAVALAVAGLSHASSQPARKTIRGLASEEIRVAVLRQPTPGCTTGPRPEVRVLEVPKNGTLRVGPRTLHTSRVKNCPRMEVPVTIVFYTSRPAFSGTDTFTIEVRLGTGAVQVQAVTVEVQAAI